MRPRRLLVKLHRWGSIGILAWVVVVSITGAYLVVQDGIESVLHRERYDHSSGDVGMDAAIESTAAELPAEASVYGLTLPNNGRGVYQVYAEIEPPEGSDVHTYLTAYVDPGSGEVNGLRDEAVGFSWWMYRGHMYLWQDHGLFGVFDPEDGWCRRNAEGAEPGGVKGVVCDVIPDGMDMVAWLSVVFIGVLLTGFYLWYWPGVRRWATALTIRRGRGAFTFNLSLHKVVGFVVWVPLLVVAITGAAFAFPNMQKWYDNVTPAARDFTLWTPVDEPVSEAADGRQPLSYDDARQIIEERYPTRALRYLGGPFDETGTYSAWVTRGVDPWTREGGAGNTYLLLDQYTGATLYDGTPEEGNTFDQAWDDWSFPTHAGDVGGTVTRVLWVLLGLSPIVLGTTGLTMYLIRRRKRANRGRRSSVAAPEVVSPAAAVATETERTGPVVSGVGSQGE